MRNNRKGMGFLLVIMGVLVILFITIPIITTLYKNSQQNPFKNPEINSSFNGIQATGIMIVDDPSTADDNFCTKSTTRPGLYDCKITNTVKFEVNIVNNGNPKSGAYLDSVYGGMAVCNSECDKNNKCTPITGESCFKVSGGEKCSIPVDGKPYVCEAGAYMFGEATYFIYPMVVFPVDELKKSSSDLIVTETVKVVNPGVYIEIRGSKGYVSGGADANLR